MASHALYIPVAVRVKKAEDVTRKILEIQIKEGGKISIITIQQDLDSKEWVIFYYPYKGMPNSAL